MASNSPIAPFFYLSYSGQDSPYAFGLGVNSPYGLVTEWKENSFSKYYATKSKLLMYSVNPTIAYAVNDKLSLGLGLDYFNLFDVELKSKAINGGPLADGNRRLSGDGTGWGYNFAINYKANERHSLGLSYRSQVNVIVEGEEEFTDISGFGALAAFAPSYNTDVQTEFKFPQTVTVGYGFRANDKWTFMADYEWANWNVVTETKLNRSPSALNNALPGSIPRNWKNSNNVGLGTNMKAKEWWDVRFGFVAYEQVVPSSTLEASLPDASRYGPTIGSGFRFGNTTIDLSYEHTFIKKKTVNNAQESALYSQDGTFEGDIDVISLSLTQKWGGKS
jgi:long-chain fatty acid transport protein